MRARSEGLQVISLASVSLPVARSHPARSAHFHSLLSNCQLFGLSVCQSVSLSTKRRLPPAPSRSSPGWSESPGEYGIVYI